MGAPGPGDYERESILGCLALGTLCAGEIRLRRRFFLLRPKRRFSGLAPGERSEPGASIKMCEGKFSCCVMLTYLF